MKHIQFLLISLCITTCSIAQNKSKTFSSAVDYNNYIVYKQQDVGNQVLKFSSVKELKQKEQVIDAAIPKIVQYVKDIKNMPAWKGNTEFRNASAALFQFYAKIFSTSYKQIIHLQYDGLTQEKENKIKQIASDITTEETKLDEDFKTAQQNFAAQNNMAIQQNPLQKKIDDIKKNKN